MEERVFLNEPYANITSTKIVINGATYATRNVGSVRVEMVGRPAWPWIIILFGLFISFGGAILAAIVIAGIGALILMALGPKAKLHLMAGGGEQMAIESTNVAQVNSIHAAVVEAISAR